VRTHLPLPAQPSSREAAALAALERQAANSPSDPQLQYQLGTARAALGQLDGARTAFQRLCQLTPTNPPSWVVLGDFELRAGELRGAEQAYRRAVALTPNDASVLCALAQTLLRRGFAEEAEHLVTAAQRAAPHAGRPHFLRAQLVMRSSATEVALPELRRAVELEPDYLPPWLMLAAACLELRRWADVDLACNGALRVDPGNSQALAVMAQARVLRGAAGDAAEAETLAMRALKANPRHGGAHYVLGLLALRANRVPDAIEHLEAALLAEGTRVDARSNLARAYRLAGRTTEAEQQLKLVAQQTRYRQTVEELVMRAHQSPRDPRIHQQLAELYASVGGREKAISEYEKTVALEPGNQAARTALDRLRSEAEPGHASAGG